MGRLLVGMLLLLLIAGCSNADGDDLIVLQDGSHRTGTLQGCLSGRCQLNGRAIPQATIAWIGLHQARSNPPQPNDPAVAEIRMIDRSVHPGLMTAIDPTRVTTLSGSYDRQKVAWVYLTHPAQAAASPSTSPTGSSAGPDNCGNPKIYHYDIEVTVHRDEAHTFTPWHTPGTVRRVFDWDAKWSHAPMSVELCKGRVRVLLPAGVDTVDARREGLAAGESTVKIDWNDASELIVGLPQDPSSLVPTCRFTDVSGSPAKTVLNGSWDPDGNDAEFAFSAARINPPPYPIDKDCDHRRYTGGGQGIDPRSVSSGGQMINGTLWSPFHTIEGLDWILSEESLRLSVSKSHAPMPFPLDALAHGKGFDFRTGPLQAQIRTAPGKENETSDAVSDWATVNFTPTRP